VSVGPNRRDSGRHRQQYAEARDTRKRRTLIPGTTFLTSTFYGPTVIWGWTSNILGSANRLDLSTQPLPVRFGEQALAHVDDLLA
jgi:hypothetical protein